MVAGVKDHSINSGDYEEKFIFKSCEGQRLIPVRTCIILSCSSLSQ